MGTAIYSRWVTVTVSTTPIASAWSTRQPARWRLRARWERRAGRRLARCTRGRHDVGLLRRFTWFTPCSLAVLWISGPPTASCWPRARPGDARLCAGPAVLPVSTSSRTPHMRYTAWHCHLCLFGAVRPAAVLVVMRWIEIAGKTQSFGITQMNGVKKAPSSTPPSSPSCTSRSSWRSSCPASTLRSCGRKLDDPQHHRPDRYDGALGHLLARSVAMKEDPSPGRRRALSAA